jgi:gluconolactonase
MIFVSDLANPEGPVLLPDGSWVIVEMHPDRGWVARISTDGKEKDVLAKTGRPNGLALDKHGVLWVAESLNPPSLLRMTLDGEHDTVLTECDGEPFLFPNDLCFGPHGELYMTDSGVKQPKWATFTEEDKLSYQFDGRLYRIDTATMEIEKLDSGLKFTNGIAFGPDEYLYINESRSGDVFRYKWEDGHIVGKREFFANVLLPDGPNVYRGPDGMAFDKEGNLYVTVFVQGDITVLAPDGSVLKRLPLVGKRPTNAAFGPDGEKRLYVTDQDIGQMEVYDVGIDGLPLYG